MKMAPVLIDTDTLSEVIKGHDHVVVEQAAMYLTKHKHFTFSIITRYEILRGLLAKRANRQIEAFEERCRRSTILSISDAIVKEAANIMPISTKPDDSSVTPIF
jgi:tRNA(fMet)-specific endonuclease VapC